jgi:hypothetical protein
VGEGVNKGVKKELLYVSLGKGRATSQKSRFAHGLANARQASEPSQKKKRLEIGQSQGADT